MPRLSKLGFGRATIRTAKRGPACPVRKRDPRQARWDVFPAPFDAGTRTGATRPQFGQHLSVWQTWFLPTRPAHVESVAYLVQLRDGAANLDSSGLPACSALGLHSKK